MVARPIKPEEKLQARKLQSIAFLLESDFSKLESNLEESSQGFETTRAIFNNEGKMCACMELLPFKARFDGHTIALGGIGGVVTLPEERRKGHIRNIFSLCMDEMFENGYMFSYLFPFSHEYYRKFGYEINMSSRQLSIPLSATAHFEHQGSISQHIKGMDTGPIQSVYSKYISDKNLAIVRDKSLWDEFFDNNPYKDNVYIYLWHDRDDCLRGYVKFSTKRTSGHSHDMIIGELVYLDRDALTGIFAFLGDFTSQFENLVWDCPEHLDILSYFPEPYDIGQRIITNGMNRVINAENALNLLSPPKGSGEVVVYVVDSFFDKNTACYKIMWESGSLEATTTQKEPDMTLDIRQLAQLMTGYKNPISLMEAGKVEVRSKPDILTRLFAPKKLYINDKF